ncbi:MAG: CAP domain-containing protein [Gaiellaceae bacterium]
MAIRGTKRLAVYVLGTALLCGAVTGLLVPPVAYSAPARVQVKAVTPLNRQILRELNRVRRAHDLAPLERSSRLAAAAAGHSRSMAAKGYFAHRSADDLLFWKRIKRFYPSSGYGYWEVGENLVWAAPELGAKRAVRMWMASPPHRVNLLNPRWRQIGLAAVHSSSAPGAYGDMAVTIVTADFGVRS